MYFDIVNIILYLIPIFVLVAHFIFNMSYKQIVQVFCFFFVSSIAIGLLKGFSEVLKDTIVLNGTTIAILLLAYLLMLKKSGVPFNKSFYDKNEVNDTFNQVQNRNFKDCTNISKENEKQNERIERDMSDNQ